MKRRAFRSLLIGVVSAVCALIAVSLALAVFGLYQSGHGGQAWTDAVVIDRAVAHLTTADLVALTAGLCVGVGAFSSVTEHVDPGRIDDIDPHWDASAPCG
jgi:opacity protein-like surface antigen